MNLLDALRGILDDAPRIKLRCKPGQIARIIQRGPNLDRWVHIERAVVRRPGHWHVTSLQPVYCFTTNTEVESGRRGQCADRFLAPIEDRNGYDETLFWVHHSEQAEAPRQHALDIELPR